MNYSKEKLKNYENFNKRYQKNEEFKSDDAEKYVNQKQMLDKLVDI